MRRTSTPFRREPVHILCAQPPPWMSDIEHAWTVERAFEMRQADPRRTESATVGTLLWCPGTAGFQRLRCIPAAWRLSP